MKTFRIKMVPKKGGPTSYALMQSHGIGALYAIAPAAYPGFIIINIS
jgi:hypothetical protein